MPGGDLINVRSQRVALVLKARIVVTEPRIHSPFGVSAAFARISSLISAMFFTPPTEARKIELRGRHEAGGDEVAVPVDETGRWSARANP